MVLPDAAGAVAWLLETARAAVAAGERIDLDTVLVLRSVAPHDPVVSEAIEQLDLEDDQIPSGDVAARAREVAAAFRVALDAQDQDLARQVVSDFETELLGLHRPGETLGSLDADIAIASVLLDIWDAGQQLPHQMMAEELMLIALRVHWPRRRDAPFKVQSEAARALARLHRSTNKPEYYDSAIAVLHEFGSTFRTHGLDAARYVLALQVVGTGPTTL